MLYLPCLGIHVLESEGASFGLRFAQMDSLSGKCGYDLYEGGSQSQVPIYVKYVSVLSNEVLPPGEAPKTLPELRERLRRMPPQDVDFTEERPGDPGSPVRRKERRPSDPRPSQEAQRTAKH